MSNEDSSDKASNDEILEEYKQFMAEIRAGRYVDVIPTNSPVTIATEVDVENFSPFVNALIDIHGYCIFATGTHPILKETTMSYTRSYLDDMVAGKSFDECMAAILLESQKSPNLQKYIEQSFAITAENMSESHGERYTDMVDDFSKQLQNSLSKIQGVETVEEALDILDKNPIRPNRKPRTALDDFELLMGEVYDRDFKPDPLPYSEDEKPRPYRNFDGINEQSYGFLIRIIEGLEYALEHDFVIIHPKIEKQLDVPFDLDKAVVNIHHFFDDSNDTHASLLCEMFPDITNTFGAIISLYDGRYTLPYNVLSVIAEKEGGYVDVDQRDVMKALSQIREIRFDDASHKMKIAEELYGKRPFDEWCLSLDFAKTMGMSQEQRMGLK